MKLQRLNLSQLLVNRANDRHGELTSEDAAIKWLLEHKADHMKHLAKDIVESQQIYEPPLVLQEGNSFVVYDGNRRTTTLKLLAEPEKAPSQTWSKFFSDLRRKWNGEFPTAIDCQIEDDRERLDEILYRRHTGQQSGIGQSQWDAEAKSNFQRRTGKATKLNVAEEIEQLLRSNGRLQDTERLPRSNLNRLLSAEQFRNRAGIAVEGQKLKMTHDKSVVLQALEQIARDLITQKITLDDIWDNDAKRRYLDDLAVRKVLPTADQALSTPRALDTSPTTAGAGSKPRPPGKSKDVESRKTLIRNIKFQIEAVQDNRKVLDIWNELQHRLIFGQHNNAISVLFRVLLELSIDIYILRHKVQNLSKSASLADKFNRVRQHMLSKQLIDKKYHDHLQKFETSDQMFSANTLNAYVHSNDFFPSENHLKNMWDTVEKFITICIK